MSDIPKMVTRAGGEKDRALLHKGFDDGQRACDALGRKFSAEPGMSPINVGSYMQGVVMGNMASQVVTFRMNGHSDASIMQAFIEQIGYIFSAEWRPDEPAEEPA